MANSSDYVQIRALAAAADVIRFADYAAFQDERKRPCMVLHIEPVTDVLSVAIERQWLLGQAFDDHMGNELFGEMIGPIVVGAVGHKRGKSIGSAPCAHQMV